MSLGFMNDDTFLRQFIEVRFELNVRYYYIGPQNQSTWYFLRHLMLLRDVSCPISFEDLHGARVK